MARLLRPLVDRRRLDSLERQARAVLGYVLRLSGDDRAASIDEVAVPELRPIATEYLGRCGGARLVLRHLDDLEAA